MRVSNLGGKKRKTLLVGIRLTKNVLLVALRFIMVHLEWFSWRSDNMIDGVDVYSFVTCMLTACVLSIWPRN
jgi:hypothetical protein